MKFCRDDHFDIKMFSTMAVNCVRSLCTSSLWEDCLHVTVSVIKCDRTKLVTFAPLLQYWLPVCLKV
jgi:hypothetical protein